MRTNACRFSQSSHNCIHHTSCLRPVIACTCLRYILVQHMELIGLFFTTSIILFPFSKALSPSVCKIRDLQTLLINSRIPTPHTRIHTPAHSLLHIPRTTVYHSILSPPTLSQSLARTATLLQRYTTHQVPTARRYQGIFLPQVHSFRLGELEILYSLELERLTRFTRSTRSNGGCPHAAKAISTASLSHSTIEFSSIGRVITKP